MIGINSNLGLGFNQASATAAIGINKSNALIGSLSQQIATGRRINSAADDPSGLNLSAIIRSRLGGISQALENAQLDNIWLRDRDVAMDTQFAMTLRERDLAVRAANSATVNDSQRAIMQNEIDGYNEEITRIGLTHKVMGHKALSEDGITTVTEPPTRRAMDVVWVIDQTGSMMSISNSLAQAAPKMFNELSAKGFDVQMVAVGFNEMDRLTENSSKEFQNTVEGFQKDVEDIVYGSSGYMETGLTGVQKALGTESIKSGFRPDSTKIVVLLTDDDTDDFVPAEKQYMDWLTDKSLEAGHAAEEFRQKTADALKEIGAELYAVGRINHTDPSELPDQDYQDVVDKVGKGAIISLDYEEKWVDEVTSRFIISGGGGTTETFEGRDEWPLLFQVGPESQDQLVPTFKTVLARTTGSEKADVTTAESAAASIDALDGAVDFLGRAKAQAGYLQNRMSSIINDQENAYIEAAGAKSRIEDADLAKTISEITQAQIMRNVQLSMVTAANANPLGVMNLLQKAGLSVH